MMTSDAGSCVESDQYTAIQSPQEASVSAMQPDAVGFLDNNLLDLHNALRDPVSYYDGRLRRYVAASGRVRPEDSNATASVPTQPDELNGGNGALTLTTHPMKFWDSIFEKSILRFKGLWTNAPKDREKSGLNYSVRDKSSWEDVYAQLQKAREYYDGDTAGLWGRYAKSYTKKKRWFVDHSGPVARQAVKFVPQMDYATPVIAAVQVLVDAFETTSRVRETMTKGLEKDDLEDKFSNIERFLATFPRDDAIEEASVELVAATLKAIEDAIGFFLERNVKKAFSATLRGKDYQKKPLASLEQIKIRGDQLLRAAQKSHITDTQQKLDMVLNGTAVSVIEQRETGTNVKEMTNKVTTILEKLDRREASDVFLRNKLLDLLNEAQKEKERELEEKQRLKELEENFSRLMEFVEELREQARTPSPRLLPQPPGPHAFPPANRLSLLQIPGYIPSSLLLYTTQNMGYSPYSPYSPTTPTTRDYAPPQAQHQPSLSSTQSHPETLDITRIRSILREADSVDIFDTHAILEDKSRSITSRERRKADLIVSTSHFHDWVVSNESRELLVHGNFRGARSSSAYVSALSVFCATLTQTLRAQSQQHIVLVFYCGYHVERDDRYRGAKGMMRSFIAQLVRSSVYDTVTQESIHSQLDGQTQLVAAVKGGRLPQLFKLFQSLVRLLPEQVTLVCLIDGVSHYETDDFEEGMLSTINFLLGLVRNDGTATHIKVLATSPTTTDLIQHKFIDDDKSLISLSQIRDLGQGFGLSQLEDLSDGADSRSDSNASEDSD